MSLKGDMDLVSAQRVVTAAGTAERLIEPAGSEVFHTKMLIIKALTSNGGKIYVGNRDVSSTTGLDLDPGDVVTYELELDEWIKGESINLTAIWIDAAVNGEGIVYQYERL